MSRIYLSPPDVGELERSMLLEAFDSGWIAPHGPALDAFEAAFADAVSVPHAVALSSGTAALHLALVAEGIGPGDQVLVPTLTFAATANVVRYVGAEPVFVDADPTTWTIDIDLVAEHLSSHGPRHGGTTTLGLPVDLYGQCADYSRLVPLAEAEGITLIEDAAEALGATCDEQPAGSFGRAAAFSFNGNKIITASGGGMLVSHDRELIEQVRRLASQAREPALHYEHNQVGFNYRLSNLLAALGHAQLLSLDAKVQQRREINQHYVELLADLPGLSFMPSAPYGEPSSWLTVLTVDPARAGTDRDQIIKALDAQDIEARPAWKPMHLQPVFRSCTTVGGSVSEGIFRDGLCLPSGSALPRTDIERIAEIVAGAIRP